MSIGRITSRKIYAEDLALGDGTEVVNVLGLGPTTLTKINAGSFTGAVAPITEEPSGSKNGENRVFTISRSSYSYVLVFKDGLKLKENKGYTLSGATLTMEVGYIPDADDDLEVLIFAEG